MKLGKIEDAVRMSVCVQVEFDAPGGAGYVLIETAEDFAAFEREPGRWVAVELSQDMTASAAEMAEWQDDKFAVRCCARTKRGLRCRQTVTGMSNVEFATWLDDRRAGGTYCSIHDKR